MNPVIVSEKKVSGIDTLDGLHEHAVEVAQGSFAAKGSAPFRWLLRQGRKKLIVIDTPWENDAEKDMHSRLLRLFMLFTKTAAYSGMHEAWIAEVKPSDIGTPRQWIPPGRRPKDEREDVLIIASFDRSGDKRMTRFGVIHADTPRGKLLARDDWAMSDNYAGRMWNLLQPERPTKDVMGSPPPTWQDPGREMSIEQAQQFAQTIPTPELLIYLQNILKRAWR